MRHIRKTLLERALENHLDEQQLEENSVVNIMKHSIRSVSEIVSSMNTLQLMLKERVPDLSGRDKKDVMRAVMAIDKIRGNVDEILDDSKTVLMAAKAVDWD